MFSPHSLVGTVLDHTFRLERYMHGCCGAYGHPFQGTELATGQPVFVKVLCGPPGCVRGTAYSVDRELDAVRGQAHTWWGPPAKHATRTAAAALFSQPSPSPPTRLLT